MYEAVIPGHDYTELPAANDELPVHDIATLRSQRLTKAFVLFTMYMPLAMMHLMIDGIRSDARPHNPNPSPTPSLSEMFSFSVSLLPDPSEFYNASLSILPSPSEFINASLSILPSPSESFSSSVCSSPSLSESFNASLMSLFIMMNNSTLSSSPSPSAFNNAPYFHGDSGVVLGESTLAGFIAAVTYSIFSLGVESYTEYRLLNRNIDHIIVDSPDGNKLKATDIPGLDAALGGQKLIFVKSPEGGPYAKVYYLDNRRLIDLELDNQISIDETNLQQSVMDSESASSKLLALTHSNNQSRALTYGIVTAMLTEFVLLPVFSYTDSFSHHRVSAAFFLASAAGLVASGYTMCSKPYLPGNEIQRAPRGPMSIVGRRRNDASIEEQQRLTDDATNPRL